MKWQDRKGIEINAEIQARRITKAGFVRKQKEQVQDTLQKGDALNRWLMNTELDIIIWQAQDVWEDSQGHSKQKSI